jgi:hypothetical protein
MHLGLVAPKLQRLVEVSGKVAGITGAGTAQCLDVVEGVVGVLRTSERLELRNPDMHFLGRLGVWRV